MVDIRRCTATSTSGVIRGTRGDTCPGGQHFGGAKLRSKCYALITKCQMSLSTIFKVQSFRRYNIFWFLFGTKIMGTLCTFLKPRLSHFGKQQGLHQTKCRFWPKDPNLPFSAFNEPPYRNCNVQIFRFQRAPNSH